MNIFWRFIALGLNWTPFPGNPSSLNSTFGRCTIAGKMRCFRIHRFPWLLSTRMFSCAIEIPIRGWASKEHFSQPLMRTGSSRPECRSSPRFDNWGQGLWFSARGVTFRGWKRPTQSYSSSWRLSLQRQARRLNRGFSTLRRHQSEPSPKIHW